MKNIRTIDFLPTIFKTEDNRKFLRATADQLIQEPKFKPTQGFIGRKVGELDNYVFDENDRSNYQLEPAVVFTKQNSSDPERAITYPEILEALSYYGANTDKHDRLFVEKYYSWDPFVDLDKLVNYGQYYWLPNGPASVNVSASDVPLVRDFDILRRNEYEILGEPGSNPVITLIRGGAYTFRVDQNGHPFYIQSAPGADGGLPHSPNISSREVLGVQNNGAEVGEIVFNVPLKTAQEAFYNMPEAPNVDLFTELRFDQINNVKLSVFLEKYGGIDGIQSLSNLTLVFAENLQGWNRLSFYDDTGDGYATASFDETTPVDESERYNVWRIVYFNEDPNDPDPIITLQSTAPIPVLSKFKILFGDRFANRYYFKNAESRIRPVPLLTATQDVLYYQDATDPNKFGEIRLVDNVGDQKIFISDIIGKRTYTSGNGVEFSNGLKVRFQGVVEPASFLNRDFYVEGVGEAIQLLPATDFITPERYARSGSEPLDSVPYDIYGYDATLSQPLEQDYITVNRAAPDRNAWARSNRWFHRDIIEKTADYNNTFYSFDNTQRAKRPIIEFRAGLQLFQQGAYSVSPVDIVDFREVDALSNVKGSTAYGVDGYSLVQGSRVIFAVDRDPEVRNKVYTVQYSDINLNGEFQLLLIETETVLPDSNVVSLRGVNTQGKTFYFNGSEWAEGQLKESVNQPPLFDIFDKSGISFGNKDNYLSSTFNGTRLFGYADGTGITDPVLLMPLKYQNIDNIGDIVFENFYHTNTFTYVDNELGKSATVNEGRVKKNNSDRTAEYLNGWVTAPENLRQAQVFLFTGGGNSFGVDVAPLADYQYPAIKVYVDGVFKQPSEYSFINGTIHLLESVEPGVPVQIKVVSDQKSEFAYYEVPANLERNPFNENTKELSLGTIRSHYSSIVENCPDIKGSVIGANNFRDLGNIFERGTAIVQHSAPLTILSTFLVKDNYNLFDSLEFNSKEYEKFKAQMLNAVANTDWGFRTPAQILDNVIERLGSGKTDKSAFYWTDMCPAGDPTNVSRITITPISTNVFDTFEIYNLTSANYKSIQVYLNDVLLARGKDYTVAEDGPRVTIQAQLNIGDVVAICEYAQTFGSFIPNTPTKLGLYGAWTPEKYVDDSYITPQEVIRGHDGSITLAFGDIRDDVLLEFERRVFNNLKIQTVIPVELADVVPGQFRTTDYSKNDIRKIVDPLFLAWSGWHRIDYKSQDYRADNEFTWNYTESNSKLDSKQLLGNWRGIYRWMYDTDMPHTRPWEMLGFTDRPLWWESVYGPAPYTSGNEVLWDDLADGVVADPLNPHVRPQYARPHLKKILPVDSSGNLLSPHAAIVNDYVHNSWKKSWAVGDIGPAENAWMRSSAWPFVVQKILALTEPAKYFAFAIDRDNNVFESENGQYVYKNSLRISPKTVEVPEQTEATHSFLNWIIDYGRTTGVDAAERARELLQSEDVRLAYRVGGYTDKPYFRVFTEQSSPASLSRSLALPEESFHILLHKNQPYRRARYSAVIIQRVEQGFAVTGYSLTQPYFTTHTPVFNAVFDKYTDGSTTVRVPRDYNAIDRIIPYGTVYSSVDALITFLVSYGKWLEAEGILFEGVDGPRRIDWPTMGREFLHWSRQGWPVGSIITVNPVSIGLRAAVPFGSIDSLVDNTPENVLLSQNKTQIKLADCLIDRFEDEFILRTTGDDLLANLTLRFISYEHIVIFDNKSSFGDLVYDPATGFRQNRLRISGYKTDNWNGKLDAPGFMYNEDNIQDWVPNKFYTKGAIVKFKNRYWSAANNVQPSEEFEFSKWFKSDYNPEKSGLLPNLAQRAEQFREFYNNKTANLEQDADLLAFGLIGFKPRGYLKSLDLDDISQVGIYSEFIKNKGTLPSAELFSKAGLGKEFANYNVFENWAIRRAVYGASANRNYVELQLNEDSLQSNPATIEVIRPGELQQADQSVFYQNIYKKTDGVKSESFLPYRDSPIKPDIELPTAGFVNIEDVDLTVFSIENIADIGRNLNKIVPGATIWVAKTTAYDWGIYRATKIPADIIEVVDNLNRRSRVVFSDEHYLSQNEQLVIKGFDDRLDGVYKVLKIVSDTAIEIGFEFTGRQTRVISTGEGYVLKTMRVPTAVEISDLPYAKSVLPGAKAWVSTDYENKWRVYEKTNAIAPEFYYSTTNIGDTPTGNAGTSLAQSPSSSIIALGDAVANRVFLYEREGVGGYAFANSFEIPFDNTITDLGKSIDVTEDWIISGAPQSRGNKGLVALFSKASGEFALAQVIKSENVSDDNFGCQVAFSKDSEWAFVSGAGYVSVYQKKDVKQQSYSKIVTQDDIEFNIFNQPSQVRISVEDKLDVLASQISVLSENNLLQEGVDYTTEIVNGKVRSIIIVTLGSATVGTRITVSEKIAVEALVTSPLWSNIQNTLKYGDSTYAFSITSGSRWLTPFEDYVYDSNTGNLNFQPHITGNVVVRTTSHFVFKHQHTSGELGFGCSLAATTNGRQLAVGAKNATVLGLLNAGKVIVYQRAVRQFIVAPTTVDFNFSSPVAIVMVNGRRTNNWTHTGSTVTISDNLNVGDVVIIESGELTGAEELISEDPQENAQFGTALSQCFNNCSLYVGVPGYDRDGFENAGRVERFINRAKIYGAITSSDDLSSVVLTNSNSLIINKVEVVLNGTTLSDLVESINAAKVPNARAAVKDSKLEIAVVNLDIAPPLDRLSVLPGQGTLFDDVKLSVLPHVQNIYAPRYQANAFFGASLSINETSDSLAVGAPSGSIIDPLGENPDRIVFDKFDNSGAINESGAVYMFDMLQSGNRSFEEPAQFVFAEQITDNGVRSNDSYGTQVSYINFQLVASSPSATMYRRQNQIFTLKDAIEEILIRDPYLLLLEDIIDALHSSNMSDGSTFELNEFIEQHIDIYGYARIPNAGRFVIYRNASREQSWKVIHKQANLVDLDRVNAVNIYSKSNAKVISDLDYIDPLQGKILGAARQNIDFIGAVDPACYNVGEKNNFGRTWGEKELGRIWWDTTNTRFIEYNQDGLAYAGKRWGQLFPGSSVEIFEWASSNEVPAEFDGEVLSTENYATGSELTPAGVFETKYYFWAKNGSTVNLKAGKTLSPNTIARYIENPQSTGIPYAAFINSSTIGLFNSKNLITAKDSILHVEYDLLSTDNNVHKEFELIQENKADSFLSSLLYKKFVDSLSGIDNTGNQVPDRTLAPAEMYGVSVRPRQTFFADRFGALRNYCQQVNKVLKRHPIAESREFKKLESFDPMPFATSGEWDRSVENLTELSYQNVVQDGEGFRYLVKVDESNRNRWSIYTVRNSIPVLTKAQTFNTRNYWTYIDWYAADYNPLSKPAIEVQTFTNLAALNVPIETVVRVAANSIGKWEIYRRIESGWVRVGLENGTIQFLDYLWDYINGQYGFDSDVFDAKYFDQEPVIETRKIIEAVNEELFVGDLEAEKNKALILMFNYILQEQGAPDWLFKTSLVDVEHNIRELSQFKTYKKDNQDFVLDYISEVKPYHVKVKDFSLKYNGIEFASAYATDFDLPAYYDNNLERFVSPILDDAGTLSTYASVPSNSEIWNTTPYADWFNNYRLSLTEVEVTVGGSGYSIRPTATAIGDAIRPAVLEARIDAAGRVSRIDVLDPGEGYSSAPIIEITGGNGTGAIAVARMTPGVVRSFDVTMKFDRVDYAPAVTEWRSEVEYNTGDLVRYANRVYRAVSDSQSVEFNFDLFEEVDITELNAVDRIAGFYRANANELGLDLDLLLSGIDYEGVQVKGPSFLFDSGYGVAGYDMIPYDSINIGPEGLPTYSEDILDTIMKSDFLDTYLGTGDYSVDVDGGNFVDTFHSHAPEELMPGRAFDTLDIKVFARPGSDFDSDGHAFGIASRNFVYDGSVLILNGLENYPGAVYLYNATTGVGLTEGPDYQFNWGSMTATITGNADIDDTITATVYGVGGGNQLFKESVVAPTSLVIPVAQHEISSVLVLENGQVTTDFTVTAVDAYSSEIIFNEVYTLDDRITVVVFGAEVPLRGYNRPEIEIITLGSDTDYILQSVFAGTATVDAIVEINGLRVRPADTVEYYSDGSTVDLVLPHSLNTDPSIVIETDVDVYVDGVKLVVNSEYNVSPPDFSSLRYVTLVNAAPEGARVVIVVKTHADYVIQNNVISLLAGANWNAGDELRVITWNDTSQLNIITRTATGPTVLGTTVEHPFDTVPYDLSPGSGFDYFVDATVQVNRFELGRRTNDINRLWVTLNGYRLSPGVDFNMDETVLVLADPIIANTDVLVITSFTDSTVPDPMAFRLFKDMRDTQGIYRITTGTTTTLREELLADDFSGVVKVVDASKMPPPNLGINLYGVVTINGERLTYREIDITSNELRGVTRGTAGTAAASHAAGTVVYDMSRRNYLPNSTPTFSRALIPAKVLKDDTATDGRYKVIRKNDDYYVEIELPDGSTRILHHSWVALLDDLVVYRLVFDFNTQTYFEEVEATIGAGNRALYKEIDESDPTTLQVTHPTDSSIVLAKYGDDPFNEWPGLPGPGYFVDQWLYEGLQNETLQTSTTFAAQFLRNATN